MKDIDTKRPRKLDLNAPLMSTRRSNITSASSIDLSRTSSLRGSCDRVPFSWESSPGKPKDTSSTGDHVALPLPKPPLIRWRLEDDPTLTDQQGSRGEIHNKIDDDDDDDDTSFSDAIDLFSLAESMNTSERLEIEGEIYRNDGSFSPNFMIQRFLPAATALAASSLSDLAKKDLNNNDNNSKIKNNNTSSKNYVGVYSSSNRFREGSCVPRVGGEAYSALKSCGLQMFFPWRAKHRVCGVKSPVRRVRATLKPQLSPRNKLSSV